MLLFYIRHGDPTYTPDALTPLGKRQAESVAKRLALYGIDKVFASSSTRAVQTARPTCELLGLEMTEMPCFHENLSFDEMSVPYVDSQGNKHSMWPWSHPQCRKLFLSREVREMGRTWYEHPCFEGYPDFKAGIDRISGEVDRWLASLGYEHDPETATYRVTAENPDRRVALFAHEGVSKQILSHILDIPYPLYAMNFDMTHTGMTVIEFRTWRDDTTTARMLTLSNDSHLYRDGLPLDYRHLVRF